MLSRSRRAWESGSHFLTAARLVLVKYRLVPMLIVRAYNLTEIGQYHLPDVTLSIIESVVADLVSGSVSAHRGSGRGPEHWS